MTKLTPKQLHEMDYDELIKAHKLAEENADELSRALRRKAYANGYEQGRFDQRMETAYGDVAKIVRGSADEYVEKTQQERRDEIVEQAKAGIEELKDATGALTGRKGYRAKILICDADFVVNKEKRTVVCLLRDQVVCETIRAKGIAKCDPSDCFNVHIGKAIALHRALGLDVPVEYLDAPQPMEIRVGDVVEFDTHFGEYKQRTIRQIFETVYKFTSGTWLDKDANERYGGGYYNIKIIDDSREEVD